MAKRALGDHHKGGGGEIKGGGDEEVLLASEPSPGKNIVYYVHWVSSSNMKRAERQFSSPFLELLVFWGPK